MFYVIFAIGAIIFTYGYMKNRKEKEAFKVYYQQASQKENEINLVNHTLEEEKLKNEINGLEREVTRLKSIMNSRSTIDDDKKKTIIKEKQVEKKKGPISYQELIQQFKNADEDQNIEELSKEMEIGKGELQLLKNLSQK